MTGDDEVVVVDLRTGRHHVIENAQVDGLAWTPDGSLAVVTPTGRFAGDRIRIVRRPFRARGIRSGPLVRCPTESWCSQQAPTFTGRSDLVYLAQSSPSRCQVSVCDSATYELVREHRQRQTILASASGPPGLVQTAATDSRGSAVILTLPRRSNGYPAVWRWANTRLTEIPLPGRHAADPTW